jgi:hypothetical protein
MRFQVAAGQSIERDSIADFPHNGADTVGSVSQMGLQA